MFRYARLWRFLALPVLVGLAANHAHSLGKLVAPGDVVISEVAWMGSLASSSHEWIELYNNTGAPINLTNWKLVSLTDSTPNFTISATNCSNVVIAAQGFFLLERTTDSTVSDIVADCIYTGALSDGGETLALKDPSNNTVDTANGDGGAWPAGTTSPKATMERISLITADSDTNWDTNDGVHRNGLDANNNPINGTPKAPRQRASFNALDVVVSEIAWMGTQADSNDEWIELYNNTSQAISLTGWKLEAADGSPSIALSGTIPANGFFLLERTDDTTVSDVSADQIYTGALSNTGETLTLKDSSGNVIDTANGNGGAWPAGNDTTKATMERLDLLTPDSDANWATNDGVHRNGLDANNDPINGTPKAHKPPYVNITSPTGVAPVYSQQSASFTLSFTTDEAGPYQITVDGMSCGTGTASTGTQTVFCTLPGVFAEGPKDIIVTVTDNTNTIGSDSEPGAVIVDNTPPSVTLTAPNGGEIIAAGSTFKVFWYCTDLNLGAIPIALDYSTDGGATFSNIITSATENDGSFDWSVPNIDTNNARVRVTCTDLADNSAQEDSDADFTITTGFALRAIKTANLAACTEGYKPIIYTITIANISTVVAQPDNPGPEFEDPLPAGTVHVSARATSGIVGFDGTKLTWNGSLAPNSSVTIIWEVTHNLPTGTEVSNQGTVFFDADFNGTNESSVPTDAFDTPTPNDPTVITTVILGDVNRDGKVNAIDARMVEQHAQSIITLPAADFHAADVDCGRDVDSDDATYVARKGIGIPTGSGNPNFALPVPATKPTTDVLWLFLALPGFACLRWNKKLATLLLVSGLSLGLLTACTEFAGLPPPSGPAIFLTSTSMPSGAIRTIDMVVQQITTGGGVASVQGRITFPSSVVIQGVTGLNGFVVKAFSIDNAAGELRFSLVKPTAGGVSSGSVLRLAVSSGGAPRSIATLSWAGTAQAPIVVGGETNTEITSIGFGNGQIKTR